MAERMEKDRGLMLHHDHRYLRALLGGLSDIPTYTLFYILSQSRPYSYRPSVKKIWEEVESRLDLPSPKRISLEQISKVSRELLQRMEKIGKNEET